MEKIDKEYLEGITRVDGGFHMFVGAYWTQVDQDLSPCLDLLRPILGPLLQVAGDRYMSLYVFLSHLKLPLNIEPT